MAATQGNRKRATAADVAAAVALGTLDPTAEVVTGDELAAERATETPATIIATGDRPDHRDNPGTAHECAIPGCRHGAAHGPAQPDRQLKLQCPNCGAVARMTNRAFTTSGGLTCVGDGGTFAVAARRTYTRRTA